jgi:hypothetical protein
VSKALQHCPPEALTLARALQICGEGFGSAADLVRKRRGGVTFTTVVERDARAGVPHAARDGGADPSACARNEHVLVGKIYVHGLCSITESGALKT